MATKSRTRTAMRRPRSRRRPRAEILEYESDVTIVTVNFGRGAGTLQVFL